MTWETTVKTTLAKIILPQWNALLGARLANGGSGGIIFSLLTVIRL
jgi:hypothetical protein